MKAVTLYGNTMCPYCGAARMLLTKKGVPFANIDVGSDPALRSEMEERSGNSTVPQIFVADTPIGGFDELYALDKSGELDKILAA